VTRPIRRVLETALYVADLNRAVAFYRDVLELRPMGEGPRLVPMDSGGATLLLLFQRGATLDGVTLPKGFIPPHDGAGPIHVAFAVDAGALEAWEAKLATHGVEVESRVQWSRGGSSIYFRDPDGHSLELVTPGVWETY
jgi:catechol 2,3-dioxygenase-like lactoylglutathione lyase family enzyme